MTIKQMLDQLEDSPPSQQRETTLTKIRQQLANKPTVLKAGRYFTRKGSTYHQLVFFFLAPLKKLEGATLSDFTRTIFKGLDMRYMDVSDVRPYGTIYTDDDPGYVQHVLRDEMVNFDTDAIEAFGELLGPDRITGATPLTRRIFVYVFPTIGEAKLARQKALRSKFSQEKMNF
jgi:hypothetical protein